MESNVSTSLSGTGISTVLSSSSSSSFPSSHSWPNLKNSAPSSHDNLILASAYLQDYLDPSTNQRLRDALLKDIPDPGISSSSKYISIGDRYLPYRSTVSSSSLSSSSSSSSSTVSSTNDTVPPPSLHPPVTAPQVVLTDTVQTNLHRFVFAYSCSRNLSLPRPILLEGPPGSGKTTILRYLANQCGYSHDMVELHLDDSTDGKALLGTYVCTDIPGEFVWQPGAITVAVSTGRWVLMEDIDRAPFEVLASLRTLMETGTLVIPGNSMVIHTHPNFQLFATRTCTLSSTSSSAVSTSSTMVTISPIHGPFHNFVHSWLRVPFYGLGASASRTPNVPSSSSSSSSSSITNDPSINELQYMISTLYPTVPKEFLDTLLYSFILLQNAYARTTNLQSIRDTLTSIHPYQQHSSIEAVLALFPTGLERYGRTLSTRDILRLVKRIMTLTSAARRFTSSTTSLSSSSVTNRSMYLTDNDRLSVVAEILSVVSGHIPDQTIRRSIGHAVAILWNLSTDSIDTLFDTWKPDIAYRVKKSDSLASSTSFSNHEQLYLQIGDTALPLVSTAILRQAQTIGKLPEPLPSSFAPTRHSVRLLDRLSACIALDEPALLVGETGNGKTSVIQALAAAVGAKLHVYNLNVQSDSSDLVGGFKPVHLKQAAMPLLAHLERLFTLTFMTSVTSASSVQQNTAFLDALRTAAHAEQWPRTIGGFMRAITRAQSLFGAEVSSSSSSDPVQTELRTAWQKFTVDVKHFERQYALLHKSTETNQGASFAFSFIDGVLVQALRAGDWILLDEINLASSETLQRLAGLLEGGSLTLTEKGEASAIVRHPNFRLFGAMNPATDFGKRDLPPSLRNRFTEIYVEDVTAPDDLAIIVQRFVHAWPSERGNTDPGTLIQRIVNFYLQARQLATPITGTLRDGAASRPHYSLRSLTRALRAATDFIDAGFTVYRAVYEGICMSFVTQLEDTSANTLLQAIRQHFDPNAKVSASDASANASSSTAKGGKKKDKQAKLAEAVITRLSNTNSGTSNHTQLVHTEASLSSSLNQSNLTDTPRPRGVTPDVASLVQGYWLVNGPLPKIDLTQPSGPDNQVRYVLVPSVARHIRSLARAVCSGRYPVLLQGPTSAGKTSMVEYLAALTGHECVRINNHEHTDISEYIGAYVTSASGVLVFAEGLLVTALRKGQWLILDELNLAPSEVLEALNRLLDDNRELFIPETQETVRPHPHFMLFATQNPVGSYGGRKPLSLAFRNRFVELHVDDIPSPELHAILMARSRLPSSFVEKMITVMQELQQLRAANDIFAGRQGFITPRDLLRWGSRFPRTYPELAMEGYTLLAERLRSSAEKLPVQTILEKVCKVQLSIDSIYDAPFQSVTLIDTEGMNDGIPPNEGSTENASVAATDPTTLTVPGSLKRGRGRYGKTEEKEEESSETDKFFRFVQSRLQSFLDYLHQRDTHNKTEPDEERDASSASSKKRKHDSSDHPVSVGNDAATGTTEEPTINLRPGSIPGTEGLSTITITRSLKRLFSLVGRCIAHDEPVLLVGETGCGKTSVIQLFALLLQQPLSIVNCHAHTETADFLGSLRPIRNRTMHIQRLQEYVEKYIAALPANILPGLSTKSNTGNVTILSTTLSSTDTVMMDFDTVRADLAHEILSSAVETWYPKLLNMHKEVTVLLNPSSDASTLSSASSTLSVTLAGILDTAGEEATKCSSLFEWVNGPLVSSMQSGGFFLLDEASLAEDAVLERLNSVLEPSRTLTLAEKANEDTSTGDNGVVVKAASTFRIFATMNPGGDYGKRELSPALRNRFTEIWVPALEDVHDLRLIIIDKAMDIALRLQLRFATLLHSSVTKKGGNPLLAFVEPMIEFVQWFDQHASSGRLLKVRNENSTGMSNGKGTNSKTRIFPFTLRDIHAWLNFMGIMLQNYQRKVPVTNSTSSVQDETFTWFVYIHGICLVLLDGLGLGMGLSLTNIAEIRQAASVMLIEQAPVQVRSFISDVLERNVFDLTLPSNGTDTGNTTTLSSSSSSASSVHMETDDTVPSDTTVTGHTNPDDQWGINPFYISRGPLPTDPQRVNYAFTAPTTRSNLCRVLRALQLKKAILLEGSPGVGKTSLIEALANATGHRLVRINLSDQTDIADLFGQDLPTTGSSSPHTSSGSNPSSSATPGSNGRFAWCDGIFLSALKAGDWILLDELNLAPQPVLEGLNAVLDHRGTVYIPELDLSFACPPSLQIFATQNPVGQGGGRKGLPKSFLNRFAKVYVEALTENDQYFIARSRYPQLDVPLRSEHSSISYSPNVTVLQLMVKYNIMVHEDTMGSMNSNGDAGKNDTDTAVTPTVSSSSASSSILYGLEGRPWEFNLRDLFRWADLIISTQSMDHWNPGLTLEYAYLARLRKPSDRFGALVRYIGCILDATLGKTDGTPSRSDYLASLVPLHTHPILRTSLTAVTVDDALLPRSILPAIWSSKLYRLPVTDGDNKVELGNTLRTITEGLLTSAISIARMLDDHNDIYPSKNTFLPIQDDALRNQAVSELTTSLLNPFYHTMLAVGTSSPVLLVGPTSSGKSTIVKTLAAICGVRLRTIPLTPSTDATELIGCFEQADTHRHIANLADTIMGISIGIGSMLQYLQTYGLSFASSSYDWTHLSRSLQDHQTLYFNAQQTVNDSIVPSFTDLFTTLQSLTRTIENFSTTVLESSSLTISIRSLQTYLADTQTLAIRYMAKDTVMGTSTSSRGAFEWVDGALVEALERGEWILIDNASFCAPSVVDRLNPLLEPHGTLLINECGLDSVTGKPRIITPHPNCRIFFTLDPSMGDVSRALRNRCVEIVCFDPVPMVPVVSSHGNHQTMVTMHSETEQQKARRILQRLLDTGSFASNISADILSIAPIYVTRILSTAGVSRMDAARILSGGIPLLTDLAHTFVHAHEQSVSVGGKGTGRSIVLSQGVSRPRELRMLGDIVRSLPREQLRQNRLMEQEGKQLTHFLSRPLREAYELVYRFIDTHRSHYEQLGTTIVTNLSNFQSLPSTGNLVPFTYGQVSDTVGSLSSLLFATVSVNQQNELMWLTSILSRTYQPELSATSVRYWQEYILSTYILAGSIATTATVQRTNNVQEELEHLNTTFDRTDTGGQFRGQDIERFIIYAQSIRDGLVESKLGHVFTGYYRTLLSLCGKVSSVTSLRLQTILPLLSWSNFPTTHLWNQAEVLYQSFLITENMAVDTNIWSSWVQCRSVLLLYATRYAHLRSYYYDAVQGMNALLPDTQDDAGNGRIETETVPNAISVTTLAIIQAIHMGFDIPAVVRAAGTPQILSLCSMRKCERILGSTAYGTIIAGSFILYETILNVLQNLSVDTSTVVSSLPTFQRLLEHLDQLFTYFSTTDITVSLTKDMYGIHPPLLSTDYLPQLLIIWRRTMKQLRSLWPHLSSMVTPHELLILRNGIRCLYSSSSSFGTNSATTLSTVSVTNDASDMFTLHQPRDILWRYGGHPRIPRSQLPYEAIYELQWMIRQLQHRTLLPVLAERMEQYSRASFSSSVALRPHDHSHKFSYLSTVPDYFDLLPGSLRYDAMIALATIVNVSSDASSHQHDIDTVVQTAQTLRQRIEQHISHRSNLLPSSTAEETKDNTTVTNGNTDDYDTTNNTLDTEILYRLQLTAISGPVLRRSVRSRITKAVERWCLMNETLVIHRLIIKLVGLAVAVRITDETVDTRPDPIGEPEMNDYQHALRTAERILHLASVATSWSPSDMYPLQIAVWLIEIMQKKTMDRTGFLSLFASSNHQLYDLLLDTWSNVYGNWQRRVEAVGMEDDITVDLGSSVPWENSSFLRKDDIDTILHSSVPLYQYEAITYLLQLIAGHGTTNLTDYRTPNAEISVQYSHSFDTKLTLTYSIMATQLFQVLATAIHGLPSYTSMDYRTTLHQWWTIVCTPLSTVSNVSHLDTITASLFTLLRTSSDTRMVQIMDSLLIPAVHSLSLIRTLPINDDKLHFVRSVYTAQVRINVLRVYLTVPASPIDPALKPAYKRSILQEQMNTKSSAVLLRQIILSIVHNRPYTENLNDTRVFNDEEIEQNLQFLTESKTTEAEYANRQVYRLTNTSYQRNNHTLVREPINSFAGLYNEIESYLTSLGRIERVTDLLQLVTNARDAVTNDASLSMVSIQNQCRMWIEASRALANRLVSAYGNFTDVAVPLQMELHSMTRAMQVLSSLNTVPPVTIRNTSQDAVSNLARLKLPVPLSEASRILSQLADEWRTRELHDEAEKAKNDANNDKTVFTMLSETDDVRMEKEFRETIPDYFTSHFGEFVRTKQDELMDYKDNGSGGGSSTNQPSNDRKETKVTLTALQIAEEHLRIYHDPSLTGTRMSGTEGSSANLSFPYDMESRLTVANESLVSRVLYQLHTETNRETETVSSTVSSLSSLKTVSYNFYRDSNMNEAILAIRPARAFASRAYALLNLFEGNEILLLLIRLTDQLLRLPVQSSIAALLTGAELLVSKAQDWENNAPTMHKLGPALMGINQLVTRWRKLELASWMKLLASVEKDQYDTAAKLWLHLRAVCYTVPSNVEGTTNSASSAIHGSGTALPNLAVSSANGTVIPSYAAWIYVPPTSPTVARTETQGTLSSSSSSSSPASLSIDTFLRQIFDSADRYIRSSTQGQFTYRLQLLESLAYELYYSSQARSPPDSPLVVQVRLREALLLLNIKTFYSQYIPGVQAALAKLVNPLMKHVKDQVTLHRWDEQNYYASRDSIEKSHRIVFKALRNYREVLSTMISPVINDYIPVATDSNPKTGTIVTKKRKRETLNASTDPSLVYSTMKHYHEHYIAQLKHSFHEAHLIASTLPVSFALPSLTYTLNDISKRGIQLLLRSSYGIFSSEAMVTRYMQSNKIRDTANDFLSTVASLHSSATATRIMKQRAMTDALRTLNKMGLSYLSVAVSPEQQQMNAIMQLPSWVLYRSTESFNKLDSLGSTYQMIYSQEQSNAESFYYRTLDQLTRIRMRIASGDHHQDLSPSEIKRSSGYAEHLLSLLFQQRTQISVNTRQLVALTYMYDQLRLLTNGTVNTIGTVVDGDGSATPRMDSTVFELSSGSSSSSPPVTIPATLTVHQGQRYMNVSKQILSRLQDIHAIIEGNKALLRSLARTMSLTNETTRANSLGGHQGVALIKDILVDEAVVLGLLSDPRDPPENISQGLIRCMKRLNTMENDITMLTTELAKTIQVFDSRLPPSEWIQSIVAVQAVGKNGTSSVPDIDGIEHYTYIDSVSVKSIHGIVQTIQRKIEELYQAEMNRNDGDTLTQSFLLSQLRSFLDDIQRMMNESNATLSVAPVTNVPVTSASVTTTLVSSTTGTVASTEFDTKLATIVKEIMLTIQSVVAPSSSPSSTSTGTNVSHRSTNATASAVPPAYPWGTEMKLHADDDDEGNDATPVVDAETKHANEENVEEETILMNLPQITATAHATMHQLNVPRIVAYTFDILSFLRTNPTFTVSATHLTALRTVTQFVHGLVTVYSSLSLDYVKVHRQVAKLSLVVTSILIRLMNDGYCTPPGGEEGGDESGNTNDGSSGNNKGEGKFHAGTGIGEGTGNKDVSNQIENEEQVLGLKNDQEKDESSKEKSEPSKPDLDTGVDMDADFDGDMHSLPPDEEEENQKRKRDNEDENDEEETDADREMGNADDDNTRIVDEKLWDGDDDDDEKEKDDKNEKKKEPSQAESQVQGGKQKGLRAKQNEEKTKDKSSKPPESDTLETEDQTMDDAEDGEDASDKDDGDQEEKDDGEYQGPIQNEDENKEDIDIHGELGKDSDNESLRGGDEENDKDNDDDDDETDEKDDRKNRIKARKEEALENEEETNLDEDEQMDGDDDERPNGAEDGDQASIVSDELGDLKQNEFQDDNDETPDNDNDEANDDDETEQRINETVPESDNGDEDGDEQTKNEEEENEGTVNNTVEGLHDDNDKAEEEEKEEPPNDANEITAPDMKNKVDQAAAGIAASNGNSRVQNTDTKNASSIDKPQQLGMEEDDNAAQEEYLQDDTNNNIDTMNPNPQMETDDKDQDIRPQDQGSGDTQGGTEGSSNQQGMWKRAPVPKNNIPQASLNKNPTNNQNNPRKNIRQDPNPLLDPSKALRHWEAKLRSSDDKQSNNLSDENTNNDDNVPKNEEEEESMRNNINDVTAQPNTGVSMLAPRDASMDDKADEKGTNDKETTDDGNDSMDDGEERPLPERSAVDTGGTDEDMDADEEDTHHDDIDTSTAANAKRGKLAQQTSTAIGSLQFEKMTNDDDDEGNGKDRPNMAERMYDDIINPDDSTTTHDTPMDITIAAPNNKVTNDTSNVSSLSSSSATILLTAQDPEQLRARYEETLATWNSGQTTINTATAISAWTALSALTNESSSRLCEGLRLILEPTLASKLGGEYRAGKRINMRKVIPYIASNFRKDKIWMRRSKPSQRTYQILLAIDDSLSMAPHNLGAGHIAIEAMALIARALSRLEVGQLGVISFGDTVNMLHSFDSPFTDDAGARILSSFTFAQQKTHVDSLLDSTIRIMDTARSNAVNRSSSSLSSVRCMQLIFIISDGLVGSHTERERIRQFVIEASQRGILIVSMIIDKQIPQHNTTSSNTGVSSTVSSSFVSPSSAVTTSTLPTHTFRITNGQVIQTPYFEDYPFPYYLILRDTQRLPEALGEALRQWFELMG